MSGRGLRPFFAALRSDGFVLVDDSRTGGVRVVQWQLEVGDRRVDLQLWGEGEHRVSHFLAGRMSTHPTPFTTIDEMRDAIERELTRTDHPPITVTEEPTS